MKRFLFILISFSLFISSVFTQEKSDSLYRVFEKSSSVSKRLQVANQIAAFLYQEKAIPKACTFNTRTPEDSIRLLVYGGGGSYYYDRSNYERAILYCKIGIEAAKTLKDTSMLSETLDILGGAYTRSGDYENAHQTMKRSREIAERQKNKEGMATVYSNMGTLYSYMKKDSLAISFYLKSVAITRTLEDDEALARRLSNLGEAYVRIKKPEKALPLFNESLILDTKIGHADKIAIRQSNLANAYMEMKKYEESEKYYLQAIATFRKMDKKMSLAISCYQMGMLKERTSQLQQAEAYYKEAEKIAQEIAFVYADKNASEGLYRVYKKSNPALALSYLEKTRTLNDSLYKSETEKQINEFQVKYQTQEKEILLLLKTQQLKTARVFYSFLTAVLILFVAFVVFLLISVKRRMKQNRRLAELNETKDKLFSIISHDLKSPAMAQKVAIDTMIQRADKYDAETLVMLTSFNNAAESQLSLLQNLLNWANIQTGKMTYSPISFNLCESIAKSVELYAISAKNKGIQIVSDMSDNCMVRADRQMINTVVRNLLNNAVKFSKPDEIIRVAISSHDGYNRVSIIDKGVGMSQQQINELLIDGKSTSKDGTYGEIGSGLGLIICKELLERNNSRLEIESNENKGTTFSFKLPIV